MALAKNNHQSAASSSSAKIILCQAERHDPQRDTFSSSPIVGGSWHVLIVSCFSWQNGVQHSQVILYLNIRFPPFGVHHRVSSPRIPCKGSPWHGSGRRLCGSGGIGMTSVVMLPCYDIFHTVCRTTSLAIFLVSRFMNSIRFVVCGTTRALIAFFGDAWYGHQASAFLQHFLLPVLCVNCHIIWNEFVL